MKNIISTGISQNKLYELSQISQKALFKPNKHKMQQELLRFKTQLI